MLLLVVARLRKYNFIFIWIIVRSCVISICIEWLIICSDHWHSILCLKTKPTKISCLIRMTCVKISCVLIETAWNLEIGFTTGYKHFVIPFYKRKMGEYVFHWYLAVPQGNSRLWKKKKEEITVVPRSEMNEWMGFYEWFGN